MYTFQSREIFVATTTDQTSPRPRNFGFMRLYRIKNQNYANFDAFHVSAMAYVTDG